MLKTKSSCNVGTKSKATTINKTKSTKSTKLTHRRTIRTTTATTKSSPLSLQKQQHQHQQQAPFSTTTTQQQPPTKVKHTIRPRRSLLYIPGSSLKMLNKAPSCGADTVCLDVEDGVALSAKELAREQIGQFLRTNHPNQPGSPFPAGMEICLRINAVSSGKEFDLDIEWLDSLPFAPHSVALPKMDTITDFTTILSTLKRLENKHKTQIQLIGMIESPRAVVNLNSILNTSLEFDNHNHLTALIFGGDDYSALSGCIRTDSNHELDFPRAQMQLQAAVHQIGCLDIVCKEFQHPTKFQTESQKSVEQGYIGRQCIHPNQIIPANQIYAPTRDSFEWAAGVIGEFETQTAQGIGAFTYKGMMIDMPTIKRAENILTRADACGMKM